MNVRTLSLHTVDLANCDKEPIHLPGSIQPHGALIVLDKHGMLTHASRNAASLLPGLPVLGQRPTVTEFWRSPALRDAAEQLLQNAAECVNVLPVSIEASIGTEVHDIVLYAHDGRAVLEFEPRGVEPPELASFAMLAHRSMAQMKGQTEIGTVLRKAVETVRSLTGFDRVMAYRFHQDESGEVVAEVKAGVLAPYVGRRFPASDIPPQARRLYAINTLRLIANVNDPQVPIDALDLNAAPLDLSYSILRSVSPIHIEYLKNINVAASMSMSIVVGGRLWGLIACHHRTAHRVPYAVRMACDVLANVVASAIQVALERQAAARRAAAVELRAKLIELPLAGDDEALPIGPTLQELSRVIPSDLVVFAHGSTLRYEGLSASAATRLLRWLELQAAELIALNELSGLPQDLRDELAPIGGLLALCLDRVQKGWIVLLRREQTASVTWSGPPDKAVRVGPLGVRLTPDGSLAEWQQSVEGQAQPWDELDLALARQVLDELGRANALRAAEMDRARAHLFAILGHDLRDPLQSISMAAALLGRGADQSKVASRISASSGRMGRLIAQVLDMSRLQGGLGLGLRMETIDLSAWVESLVEECLLAYPNVTIERRIETAIETQVDQDRIAQIVSNLLSNARQHGTLGEPIELRLYRESGKVILEIANVAAPLPEALVVGLFDPFKRGSVANQRNPNGLGLGLYIAREVAKGHGGTLSYGHLDGSVVFTVVLPLRRV